MTKTTQFILALAALALGACTAPPKTESMGQYIDSTAITTKVKANLVNKLGTSGFSVQVKTYKDDVQLSGFVNSSFIKKRAGEIAARTSGVRRVSNDLVVKPSD